MSSKEFSEAITSKDTMSNEFDNHSPHNGYGPKDYLFPLWLVIRSFLTSQQKLECNIINILIMF